MDMKGHTTCMVMNGGIGVRCCIVQQSDNGASIVLGCGGLGSSNGAQGNKHSGINSNAIIQ